MGLSIAVIDILVSEISPVLFSCPSDYFAIDLSTLFVLLEFELVVL